MLLLSSGLLDPTFFPSDYQAHAKLASNSSDKTFPQRDKWTMSSGSSQCTNPQKPPLVLQPKAYWHTLVSPTHPKFTALDLPHATASRLWSQGGSMWTYSNPLHSRSWTFGLDTHHSTCRCGWTRWTWLWGCGALQARAGSSGQSGHSLPQGYLDCAGKAIRFLAGQWDIRRAEETHTKNMRIPKPAAPLMPYNLFKHNSILTLQNTYTSCSKGNESPFALHPIEMWMAHDQVTGHPPLW